MLEEIYSAIEKKEKAWKPTEISNKNRFSNENEHCPELTEPNREIQTNITMEHWKKEAPQTSYQEKKPNPTRKTPTHKKVPWREKGKKPAAQHQTNNQKRCIVQKSSCPQDPVSKYPSTGISRILNISEEARWQEFQN